MDDAEAAARRPEGAPDEDVPMSEEEGEDLMKESGNLVGMDSSDEEEDEEDEEEQRRVAEGFIVDEDEDEETRHKRKRRHHHHRRHEMEDEELDEDDLALLQENQGPSAGDGPHKRARQHADERERDLAHIFDDEDDGEQLPSVAGAIRDSMADASRAADYDDDELDDFIEDDEDEEMQGLDEEAREERRRERERDLRMSNMGKEQRARVFAKEQNRDISEKVALGLAKPTMSKESMTDARLFNRESLSNTFGDDDSYNLYDKPLFQGSSAAAAIYRRPGTGGGDDIYGGGTEDGISAALENDRFGLGKTKGFEGAQHQERRTGPVQFEKDASDPFAIDQFLDEAKRGTKRAGLEDPAGAKRARE